MEFSALYEEYKEMVVPSYTLKVGGEDIRLGVDVALHRLECELTCRREAGSLYLEAALDEKGENGSRWMKAFQIGAECTLSLGYQKREKEIFSGFLYELSWNDPLDDGVMELSAVFLDARGRLMTASCADAGSARTLSQLMKAILSQSCCKGLAGKQKIADVPKDWDLPAQRPGVSDYEVVCRAAEFLCYEFYVFGKELYFGPPRPETGPILTFKGSRGLVELKRRRTLAGQCGAIAVSGTDDRGERILSRQARAKDSGFGAKKMGAALSNDIHQPEPTVHTMAQADYLAKARMEQRQHRAGGLSGQCMGVPDLRPGRFIQVKQLSEPVNGTYYVHTVRHVLDIEGYSTYFEAED